MRNKFSKVRPVRDFVTCNGNRKKVVYSSIFNGERIVLKESGMIDTQEAINSFAPYTDLNYMLHRLSVGDTSVLSSRKPIFGNFAGMPDNPVDAINMVQNARDSFGHLSEEDRKAFGNDWRVWLSSLFASRSGASDRTDLDSSCNQDDIILKEEKPNESQC